MSQAGHRGNVVDFTARDADVRELVVGQAAQLTSQPLAFAPLPKRIPIFFERAVVYLPLGGCRLRFGGPVDRAHRGLSRLDRSPGELAGACDGALNGWLTFSLPAAYS